MGLWPRHDPVEDTRSVGIGFIDLLFAFVAGTALDVAAHPSAVPPAGRFQLVLALVTVVLSWIGYHNSLNRPTYIVRFPNLPLAQLSVDIALVIIYYYLVATSEGVKGNGSHSSARPETWLVFAMFWLYVVWDIVGQAIRRDVRYTRRPVEFAIPIRRWTTVAFACATAIVVAVVAAVNPSSRGAVEGIDGLLLVLIVGFRFAKEGLTPEGSRPLPRK